MDTNVNKRMLALLDHYSLSQSEFANAINVQRSAISHLLSGRNKPSIDLLSKISAIYTDISLDWLITGKGGMINSETLPVSDSPKTHSVTDVNKEKVLQRIVFFYDDDSFEVYHSQK